MKLVVQPIQDSPYFDVVDVDPPSAPGARVIRASYCTREEAELFASAPAMKARIAELERQIGLLTGGSVRVRHSSTTEPHGTRNVPRADLQKERG